VLATPEGRKVWERDRLKGKRENTGSLVVVMLPARRLTSRDYVLSLKGAAGGEPEDVGKYSFRVVRR
jgi:hypothetical protein